MSTDSVLDAAFGVELERIDAALVELEAERGRVVAARKVITGDSPAEPVQKADRPAKPKPRPKSSRKSKSRAKPTQEYKCECGRVFGSKQAVSAHLRFCDAAKAADPSAGDRPPKTKPASKPNVPGASSALARSRYTCADCGDEFMGRGDLARHRREQNHYGQQAA